MIPYRNVSDATWRQRDPHYVLLADLNPRSLEVKVQTSRPAPPLSSPLDTRQPPPVAWRQTEVQRPANDPRLKRALAQAPQESTESSD